jgi:hypothetical protein
MSGNSISGKAAIVGIGETDYLRGTDQSILQMILSASMAAIKDAGLKPSDVDGIIPPPGFVAWDEIAAHLGVPDVRYTASSTHQCIHGGRHWHGQCGFSANWLERLFSH